MSADLIAVVVAALAASALCAAGPWLIAGLPEPTVDEDVDDGLAPDADQADTDSDHVAPERTGGGADEVMTPAPDSADTSALAGIGDPPVVAEPKPSYADIATTPGLAAKLIALGALAGGLVGWRLGWQPALLAWTYLAAAGTVLGYVDLRTRFLPTRIIAPSYGVVVVLLGIAALVEADADALIRSGLGWLAFGGFYVLMWVIYPRGLGYGDVRLSGLLGLALGYVGWPELLVGLYSGLLLGGVIGGLLSVAKIFDRKKYPFGPFMLAGAVVGLWLGPAVTDWYLG